MKTEIRKMLGSDKLILGSERVLKAVRKGGVVKVVLASNAPDALKAQLEQYRKLGAPFHIEDAGMPNDELGTLCKKPYSIAALAILS